MKSTVKNLTKDTMAHTLEQFSYHVFSVAYLNEDSSKKSPRSILNNYKLLVMLGGQASIHLGRNIYYTHSGDCVLFAPGSLYHAEISGTERCQFVSINFTLSTPRQDRNFSAMLGLKDVAIYTDIIPENTMQYIYSVFRQAAQEADGHYYNTVLLLKRLVGVLVYNRQHAMADTGVKNLTVSREQTVHACHNYIINNPGTAVTVAMLCAYCNVSQSYLYKCFSSVLGISSKEFITRTKLDMAAKSLLQTDKSVTRIAAENGYSNSYRFSNIFKKVYGVSPSHYRRQNR